MLRFTPCRYNDAFNELLMILKISKKEMPILMGKLGINLQEVCSLLKEIEYYHTGVYKHSLNVASLSAQLALKLNLTAREVLLITIGALFHDVGKISLPYAILDKESKLNKDEWLEVKKHPKVGVSLVSSYAWGMQLEPMIRLHHERLDGQGYYNVSPEKIPLSARIISITDAFDAMFSPRPYQKERDYKSCWEEIERCSGTQFDPDLLSGFYSVIARGMSGLEVKELLWK